ncbi:MAG TPA: Snf7 family protein [Candidatus Hodarchaeales archaeon]|nr:Snf7 family protein [Candidatus Hodarchaeales archaeon]
MARQNLQRFIISMRLVERRLERQSSKLKKEEFKMAKEVRHAIETDDMDAAKLFAKDIARNRHMVLNLQTLRSRVKGISFKLEQASAVQQLGGDIRGLVRSLVRINRQMAIPEMERLLMGMETEMETLNMTTETLEEGFESISAGTEGESEDAEANQIIEELQAAKVSGQALPTPADSRADEITNRLQKLKEEKK